MIESNERDATERTRSEHSLHVFVPFELKERVRVLARKYDRTNADILRAVIRIGIPMMEGISEAEGIMVKEYVELFRRFRQVKSLKDI